MTKTMRRLGIVGLLASILLLGLSCGRLGTLASAPSKPPLQAPADQLKEKVVVAFLYVVTQSQLFVGNGQGYFTRELGEGVKLDLRAYPDGTQIMTAFRNGEIDVAYVGSVPALLSFVQKPDFKIVGGTNLGGTVLVVRKDAGITKLEDLKGKTVAVPGQGNFQDIVLRSVLLPKAGLEPSANPDPQKVRVVTVGVAQMLAALKEKSVDAALTFEPWGSQILLDNSVATQVLVDWNGIWKEGKYPSSVLIASNEMITQYPQTLRRFLRAHVEANLYAEKNDREARKIFHDQLIAMQGTGLSMEIIDSAFPRSKPTYDPSVEATMEFAQLANKAYPDRVDKVPAVADLFDLRLLNEVLREKGLQPISYETGSSPPY